ncbi:uncharacterized protein LOC132750541 [Ruditapes philippinarum]|uniref:uncharacterized protein LOC132750541 n=1 Tax=Ruditapes philippinarum TaxID=129788 RepID=UPI00295B1F86|nr:uncharacterized protein LOC132750541 [Ruditapes philippinarum]
MDGNLIVYLFVIFFFTAVFTHEKFVEEITNFQYSECEQTLERVYCKALNIRRGSRQKPSLWPPGPFAIPMSRSGCPESENRGWRKGVLHVKKLGRKNLKKMKKFEMNFCVKLRNDTDLDTENWIPGRYSIYMIGEECPAGFRKDTIQESYLQYDSFGPIPNITEIGTLRKKILRIGICKKIGNKSTGNKKASNVTYRMLETPFMVLKVMVM